MRFLRWVMAMFGHREIPVEAIQSQALAQRITERADDLQQHLSRYKQSRDPFAAMLADFYNRDQVSQIWHGPPRD